AQRNWSVTAQAMVPRRGRRRARVDKGLLRAVTRAFDRAEALAARRKFRRAQKEKKRRAVVGHWYPGMLAGMFGILCYMEKRIGKPSIAQELQAIRSRAEQVA